MSCSVICIWNEIATDTALRALLDAGFRCLAAGAAWQLDARTTPASGPPAASREASGNPPSVLRLDASPSSLSQASLGFGQPVPDGTARRRVPARFARGGGASPPTQTAAGAAQNAWAFCLCRRPQTNIFAAGAAANIGDSARRGVYD